jgi:hypothetical protein
VVLDGKVGPDLGGKSSLLRILEEKLPKAMTFLSISITTSVGEQAGELVELDL